MTRNGIATTALAIALLSMALTFLYSTLSEFWIQRGLNPLSLQTSISAVCLLSILLGWITQKIPRGMIAMLLGSLAMVILLYQMLLASAHPSQTIQQSNQSTVFSGSRDILNKEKFNLPSLP